MRYLYFDVTGVVYRATVGSKKVIATRIRQLGVERVCTGSDGAAGGNLAPCQAWVAFRQNR